MVAVFFVPADNCSNLLYNDHLHSQQAEQGRHYQDVEDVAEGSAMGVRDSLSIHKPIYRATILCSL